MCKGDLKMKMIIALSLVVLALLDYGYTVNLSDVHSGETEKAFTVTLGDKYKL
jgi:hypothetical protein